MVNEISSILEYRCMVKKHYCNLARRLKLLIPLFEEIRNTKELVVPEEIVEALKSLREAIESAKELLRFGCEGARSTWCMHFHTFNSTSSFSALSSLSLTNSSYLPNLTHLSKATPPSTASIPSNPLPSSSSSSFSPSSSSSPTPLPPSSLSFPISSSHSTQPFSSCNTPSPPPPHRPDLRSPSQLRHHLRANLRSHLSPLSNPRLPAQALLPMWDSGLLSACKAFGFCKLGCLSTLRLLSLKGVTSYLMW
ncbi:u-box domain-containing protein 13 [Quercus suber]|uniref:U-box domain-containing protein 13 n=1 Tax=Quercus suber TaxID=58331 RepID=A0AAW0JHF3_QUESU